MGEQQPTPIELGIDTHVDNADHTVFESITKKGVAELLDSVEPKYWPKIIDEQLRDNLWRNQYDYGVISYKVARGFLSCDDVRETSDRHFREDFISGVTDELAYDFEFKRFMNNVYEIVHTIGTYKNRYLLSPDQTDVVPNKVEVDKQKRHLTYTSVMDSSDDKFYLLVCNPETDLSQLTVEQLGDVLKRLLSIDRVDEVDVLHALEQSLFSNSDGRKLFLEALELVATKYSCASTGQSEITKIYALWETVAQSADYFGFSAFFDSTLRMYGHSAVDPFLKMRFVIELNKWLVGNQGYSDFILQRLSLSDAKEHSNAILLDLLHKQSRSDIQKGSAVMVDEIISKCEGKCKMSERNYFLQTQLEGIKDQEKGGIDIGTYAPLYIGDGQYIIFDPYGAAYLSEKKDSDLISVLAKHTRPRILSLQKIPSVLTPDRKNDNDSSTFSESGPEEHEEFLNASGEDFIDVAQEYGFHLLNKKDFPVLGKAGEPLTVQEITEYQYMVQPSTRVLLYNSFGVELSQLSRKEQFLFLKYLNQVSVANTDTMKKFTSRYRVDGVRAFLSLERGEKTLGDDIVAFGQHDVAATVFRYYGALLDSAERAEELVREVSGCDGEACNELAEQVRENILNRAQIDLERAVRAKTDAEKAGLAERLQTYVAHAKEYVALLQEVGGRVESKSAGELSASEREQMKILQRGNYNKLYKGTEFDEFKEAVFAALDAHLDHPEEHPDTVFNILKDSDKVVSFNRFDVVRSSDGREINYFGSFNADPAYSGVGGVMLEETVSKCLEDGRPMMAHCDPTQDISKKYIEDGFVATALVDFHGHGDFEIWRTQHIDVHFLSKQMTVAELLARKNMDGSMIVRKQCSPEHYDELRAGKVLTRSFKDSGLSYVVFEPLPEPLRETFRLEP
ncbi:MAG: hypothetical protein KBD21_02540 [Candidatus Pacebacteria bacterium]|nr:hypothetical protein [Candidatus Paceibacterota bacterium]